MLRTNPRKRSLQAVDLFSGCGGLSLGLRQAGIRVVGAVEIDHSSAETYALNHPQTKLWVQDIRSLSPKRMMAQLNLKRGELAVLAACAPCQGFSRLSTKNGSTARVDERNDLVLAVVPFLKTFLPQTVFFENVPAAKSSRQLARVREALDELGYKSYEGVVNMADYGLPQRRLRFVLVASRFGVPNLPRKQNANPTVRDAIGELPVSGASGDPAHDVVWKCSDKIRKLVALIPPDGGSRSALPKKFWLDCHKKFDGFSDVYGRMAWDQPSPTITSGFVNPSKGRFLHPQEDRPLTLREAATLQGFSNDFAFLPDHGKYAVARMIGNAVPPRFARLQAAALKKVMR